MVIRTLLLTLLIAACGDLREVEIEKRPGPAGEQGEQGEQGERGINGEDGQDGKAGVDGTNGKDGKNADPCTVIQYDDGAEIECPDGTTAYIYHGQAGANGTDGRDGRDGQDGEDGEDGANGIDNTEPVYVGYYCSRTVIRIGNSRYIVHGNLIPLNKHWLYISHSCEIRFKNGQIQTRDPE